MVCEYDCTGGSGEISLRLRAESLVALPRETIRCVRLISQRPTRVRERFSGISASLEAEFCVEQIEKASGGNDCFCLS